MASNTPPIAVKIIPVIVPPNRMRSGSQANLCSFMFSIIKKYFLNGFIQHLESQNKKKKIQKINISQLPEKLQEERESLLESILINQNKIFVTSRSKNLIKELQSYTWMKDREGNTTHEININPVYMAMATDLNICQTLVHEMVHLWQYEFGKPSRAGYHNKEWAAKMEVVGLMPSDTGKPGGKKTGQQMDDYPIEKGKFEKAFKKMPKDILLPFKSSEFTTDLSFLDALIKEVETIVYSGTKLDISYCLDDILDEDQQEEIMEYFMDAETDDIQEALEEFDGDYEEEDLRLMRIRFLSEVGN